MVKCQATRSRIQNRKTARRLLGERIEELTLGGGARTAIKAAEAARKKASKGKKARRKYRRLGEEREAAGTGGGAEGRTGDQEAGNGAEYTPAKGALDGVDAVQGTSSKR